jgi:hypothetical protein
VENSLPVVSASLKSIFFRGQIQGILLAKNVDVAFRISIILLMRLRHARALDDVMRHQQ